MIRERIAMADLWIVTGISKETGQVVQRWVVWAPSRATAVEVVETHGALATEEELSAAPFVFDHEDEDDLVALCEV